MNGLLYRIRVGFLRLVSRAGALKSGLGGGKRLFQWILFPRGLVLGWNTVDQSELQPEQRFSPDSVGRHLNQTAASGVHVWTRVRQTGCHEGEAFQADHLVYLGPAKEKKRCRGLASGRDQTRGRLTPNPGGNAESLWNGVRGPSDFGD